MQAFRFRLESVLRVQERRKKLADIDRQKAQHALSLAEAEVRRLEDDLRATSGRLKEVLAQGAGWTALQACHARARWLAKELESAEQTARARGVEYARAHEHYRKCAIAVEVLQHLRERRWREHKDALAALEQQRIEEIVMRRWQAELAEGVDSMRKDVS